MGRGAQRDQLVGIHRHVAGVLAAEGGFRRAVFDEVAGHPVGLAGTGEALHGFSEIPAMQLGSAFAGGADEGQPEARLKGERDERGFALVVIGRIRRRGIAAGPGPQCFDPKLLFHILMILLRRPVGRSGVSRGRSRSLCGQSAGGHRHGESESEAGERVNGEVRSIFHGGCVDATLKPKVERHSGTRIR